MLLMMQAPPKQDAPEQKSAAKPAPEASQQQKQPQKPAEKSGQQQVDPQQKPSAKLEAPPPPASSLQGPHTDVPHSQIRRIIASRLLESKQQIPHLYVSRKADMAAVTLLRQSMKQDNIKVRQDELRSKATKAWPWKVLQARMNEIQGNERLAMNIASGKMPSALRSWMISLETR